MTAQDSNESGSGSKDFLPFDPAKWYSTNELKQVLGCGNESLQQMESEGVKPLKRFRSYQWWGGDVHTWMLENRG